MAGEKAPTTQTEARRRLPASTRQRIIDYLKIHRAATATELAQAWGLTAADLRYHLAQLSRQGILEKVHTAAARDSGPGRPALYYRLARDASPDNLPALCQALLVNLVHPLSDEDKRSVMQSLAQTIVTRSISAPGSLISTRLNQLTIDLNNANYQARWEAHSRGPRLILRNCPYAAVIQDTPELCQMDRAIIEGIVQAEARQTMKINPESTQASACVFEISNLHNPNRKLP